MPIDCEVVPRPDAKAAELKALGSALLRWYVDECKDGGIAHSVDTEALIELLNGRLPAPRVPRPSFAGVLAGDDDTTPAAGNLNGYEMPAIAVEQLRQALAVSQRPALLLRIRDANYDRGQTVAALHRYVSAHLVSKLLVEGRSWDVD
jgi:hypothetical protein